MSRPLSRRSPPRSRFAFNPKGEDFQIFIRKAKRRRKRHVAHPRWKVQLNPILRATINNLDVRLKPSPPVVSEARWHNPQVRRFIWASCRRTEPTGLMGQKARRLGHRQTPGAAHPPRQTKQMHPMIDLASRITVTVSDLAVRLIYNPMQLMQHPPPSTWRGACTYNHRPKFRMTTLT